MKDMKKIHVENHCNNCGTSFQLDTYIAPRIDGDRLDFACPICRRKYTVIGFDPIKIEKRSK